MGGVESSTGAVIRNGDWEHHICWSEAKPNNDSSEVARTFENGSFIKRYLVVSKLQLVTKLYLSVNLATHAVSKLLLFQ